MTENVRYELKERVAFIRMDDTKVNAFSHGMISGLHRALDQAEEDAARVLVLEGRTGSFSAGFDLSVMYDGPEALRRLVRAGAELLLRIQDFPRPFIAACTGHALAAGAMVLLAADYRIGVRGTFKIGLNEVSIGMTIPIIGVELARDRLSPRFLHRATALAEVFDPETARKAGYLDSVLDPDEFEERVFETAQHMIRLKDPAFRETRAHLRRASRRIIESTLEEDLAGLVLEKSPRES